MYAKIERRNVAMDAVIMCAGIFTWLVIFLIYTDQVQPKTEVILMFFVIIVNIFVQPMLMNQIFG